MATPPIRGNSNRENPERAPHQVEDACQEGGLLLLILVDLGDFGQIPGPSSVLFGRAAAGAAAFAPHYYFLRT